MQEETRVKNLSTLKKSISEHTVAQFRPTTDNAD